MIRVSKMDSNPQPRTRDPEIPSGEEGTSFCLICCQDLSLTLTFGEDVVETLGECVIKQEPAGELNNEEEAEFPHLIDPSHQTIEEGSTTPLKERPDLCASGEGYPESKGTAGWSAEDKAVFRWFTTWWKASSTKDSRGKRRDNLKWEQEGRVPFCDPCKGQLQSLVALQREVEALEKRIKEGVQDLQGKVNASEGAFRDKDVYSRDGRYESVRKRIVSNFELRAPPSLGGTEGTINAVTPPVPSRNSRKSTRTKTAVRRYGSLEGPEDTDPSTRSHPVVLLSTSDKTSAEKYIHSSEKVKQDKDTSPAGSYQGDNNEDDGDWNDPFMDTGGNDDELNDDDLDFQPSKKPRKKRRYSKRAPRKSTKGLTSSLHSEGDDLDPILGELLRSDKKLPRKRSRPRSPRKKESNKRKLDDHDWEMEEEEEDDPEGDSDLSGEDDGPRKNGRYIVDPEKRTLTYKSLVFLHLPPFTENRYECSKCHREIDHVTNNRIRSHYLRLHTRKHACHLCDYRADGSKSLKLHVRRVHEGIPGINQKYPCRICEKPIFRSKRKGHEWTHKNEEEKRLALDRMDSDVPWQHREGKRHQCEECGRKFLTPTILKEHKDCMHGSEEVRESRKELCPECGERYVCLKEHRRRVHGVDGRYFTCLEPGCGITLKSLSQLKRHKDAVHRKIRPHKCTLCPRTFSNMSSFQSHMNLHNGIRPFQCEQCPSAFTTKAPLQRHVKLYHGEGPAPRRKAYTRGPTMLGTDVRKRELINEGKYLPPSALASWAAGREPTSHFPLGMTTPQEMVEEKEELVEEGN